MIIIAWLKNQFFKHHCFLLWLNVLGASAIQSPSHSFPEKVSVKKVFDFIKSSTNFDDHEDIKEMNKKLRLMIEETLTKNMHLQQNLETLTLEMSNNSDKISTNSDKFSNHSDTVIVEKPQ